jgi:hypothetical protein
MAQPTQELPPWLSFETTTRTNANGAPLTTETTLVYLPLTYFGPSVSSNSVFYIFQTRFRGYVGEWCPDRGNWTILGLTRERINDISCSQFPTYDILTTLWFRYHSGLCSPSVARRRQPQPVDPVLRQLRQHLPPYHHLLRHLPRLLPLRHHHLHHLHHPHP